MLARRLFSTLTAIVSLAIVCDVPPSYSAPVRWRLQGVMFDDFGAATGSFLYDASIGKVLDWNIVASGHGAGTFGSAIDIPFANAPSCIDGSACDAAERVLGAAPLSDDFIFSHGNSPGSNGFLRLFTSRPLSDSGGIVTLIPGTSHDGTYLSCCENAVDTNLVSGVLASAPEPASLLYIFAGLAALTAFQRIRRRAPSPVAPQSQR